MGTADAQHNCGLSDVHSTQHRPARQANTVCHMKGIIYAYDVTRRETFEAIQQVWMKEVENYSTVDKAVMMIVANKVDRDSEREVSRQEGAAFAKSKGCLFVETSAKANTAVTQVCPDGTT